MKIDDNSHLSYLFSIVRTYKMRVIFASFFGLIAIAIGLSHIFAQSSVLFLFSPTSQYANTNEDKSFAITLNSNGQQVDGGSVAITYDTSLVSFTAFNDSATGGVSLSNKVSSPGGYSFDYQIAFGSQSTPTLGSITLKAKPSASTQPAYLKFTSANTNAYVGFSSSRTYYPAAYGQAAMVVNAGSAAPATTPTSTPTPTQPTSTSTSNTKPAATTTSSLPAVPTRTTSTPTPAASSPTITSGPSSPTVDSNNSPVYVDNGSFTTFQKPKRKSSVLPLLLIVASILIIGAGAIVFLKFKQRAKHPTPHSSKDLHAGALDGTNAELEEENVVVKPSVMPVHDKPAARPAAHHEYPAIITKHSQEHSKHAKPASVEPAPEPSRHSEEPRPSIPAEPLESPRPTEQTVTKVKEHTDKANHKEVEVDIMHIKPGEAAEVAVSTQPETPKPKAEKASIPHHTQSDEPKHQAAKPSDPNDSLSSASTLATAPRQPTLSHHNNNIEVPKSASTPLTSPSTPTEQQQPPRHLPRPQPSVQIPEVPVPQWQTHLTAGSHKPDSNESPPDMFELAAEHPETFGSYQALEAEASENDKNKKGLK